MANKLYEQMQGFDQNGFMQSLNDLKSKGGDPNAMIQNLLNSGRVSQSQLNAVVTRAQQIMRMLPPSVRR